MNMGLRMCQACRQTSTHGEYETSYHGVPKEPELRKAWLSFCGLEDSKKKVFYICSRHFEKRRLHRKCDRVVLRSGSIPTLYPPPGVTVVNTISEYRLRKKIDNSSSTVTTGGVDTAHKSIVGSNTTLLTNSSIKHEIQSPSQSQTLLQLQLQSPSHQQSQSKAPNTNQLQNNVLPENMKRDRAEDDDLETKFRRDLTPREKKLRKMFQCADATTRKLRKELKQLKKKFNDKEAFQARMLDYLRKKLTPNFFELLLTQMDNTCRDSRGRRWSFKVMTICLALHKSSSRSYEFLRKLMVLPSPRTLCRMQQNLSSLSNIHESCCNHLEVATESTHNDFSDCEKQCETVELLDQSQIVTDLKSNGFIDTHRQIVKKEHMPSLQTVNDVKPSWFVKSETQNITKQQSDLQIRTNDRESKSFAKKQSQNVSDVQPQIVTHIKQSGSGKTEQQITKQQLQQLRIATNLQHDYCIKNKVQIVKKEQLQSQVLIKREHNSFTNNQKQYIAKGQLQKALAIHLKTV